MARANHRGESLASKAFRVSCGGRDLLYVAGREVALLLALREHGVVLPGAFISLSVWHVRITPADATN